MSAPVRELERAIVGGKLRHGGRKNRAFRHGDYSAQGKADRRLAREVAPLLRRGSAAFNGEA
jgi:hypothetical protein